jgi:hypothetical protein
MASECMSDWCIYRIVVHVIRDKQQSLTHSRNMNYNSRLTAITHTITGHELQFEINSNHSYTVVHVPWVCEWLLFISNCSSCLVSVSDCCLSRIIVHVPWVCEWCCLSRIVVHVPWVCEWLLFMSNCSSCPVSVWVIAVYLHSLAMNYNSR